MEDIITDGAPVEGEKQGELLELEKRKKEAKNARKNKCAALTRKLNRITELMTDTVNLHKVKENVQKYNDMFEEFNDLHKQYQQFLSQEECTADTDQWYEPKLININEFKSKAEQWIQSCPVQQHLSSQSEFT
ncbi:hypothetical protein N1851_018684 [Merluccius polli]|uniref:Uncharacterized protein n=1 Tax=Merluccius polli TaxID=89951 RepID=A0AA47MNE8_MERPO|nr:hypothetical protein N1851_018684 [Merluccius polli]